MRLTTIVLGVCVAGCNMTKLATNQTADVLAVAAPSMAMESDIDLAREAAPGQLKTVEGFWFASQGNKKLMRLLAQGYCEYAFGFLDSDLEALTMAGREDEQTAKLRARTTGLYQRCTHYGLKLLGGNWAKDLEGDLAAFRAKVAGADKNAVEGMFFTALGLASAININRDNLELVGQLPRAKMMFERVVQLDEKFYNAGAHTALGTLLLGARRGRRRKPGQRTRALRSRHRADLRQVPHAQGSEGADLRGDGQRPHAFPRLARRGVAHVTGRLARAAVGERARPRAREPYLAHEDDLF